MAEVKAEVKPKDRTHRLKGEKAAVSKDRAHALEAAIKRTLDELVTDLRNPKYEDKYATELSRLTLDRPGKDLVAALQDEDSELCKAIPTDVLAKTQQGRKYLAGLSVIQPGLTRATLPVSSTALVAATTAPPVSESRNASPLGESFSDLLPGDDNKALLDLVQDVFASGELCRLEGKNTSELDTNDFLGMFSTVKDVIERKAASGTLDLETIDKQANHMMTVLSKDHPEIQDLLGSQSMMNLLPAMMANAFQ